MSHELNTLPSVNKHIIIIIIITIIISIIIIIVIIIIIKDRALHDLWVCYDFWVNGKYGYP